MSISTDSIITSILTSSSSKVTSITSAAFKSIKKLIFFYYIIKTIIDAYYKQDIKDAIALNADIFTSNLNTDIIL